MALTLDCCRLCNSRHLFRGIYAQYNRIDLILCKKRRVSVFCKPNAEHLGVFQYNEGSRSRSRSASTARSQHFSLDSVQNRHHSRSSTCSLLNVDNSWVDLYQHLAPASNSLRFVEFNKRVRLSKPRCALNAQTVSTSRYNLSNRHHHNYSTFCGSKDSDGENKGLYRTNEKDSVSGEDKSTFEKDSEFKSIIEDIKRDFANERSKDKVSESSQEQHKEPGHKLPHSGDDGTTNFVAANQFEYDYSVAEDIEEYDYIDESEIGQHQVQTQKDLPINLERGKAGVFDLDELLVLLDHLGAQDVVSFPVPPEAKFCDHMVVVSAKSRRHLQAINEEMLWVHKRKKSKEDSHLVVEGISKSDWCAMDMGNIVLHVFYGRMREYYDIESLWTLGPENDPKSQGEDQDPYALSAEDLFWLETAKLGGDTTTATSESDTAVTSDRGDDNDVTAALSPKPRDPQGGILQQRDMVSPAHRVSDSEAGWGHKPSASKD